MLMLTVCFSHPYAAGVPKIGVDVLSVKPIFILQGTACMLVVKVHSRVSQEIRKTTYECV